MLLKTISRYWGYSSFRPLQEEAMNAALGGRDSLVVMPTGGGKSLCFQVPALCKDSVTVVVSPLISLMKDQVDTLIACGAPAAMMNSSQSGEDLRAVERAMMDGRIKLLFVSPERLALSGFRSLLQRANAKTFAIDEAHCISHWGHDFRPEYRQLRELRRDFPDASVHAYTATATPQVRRDIVDQLALRDPLVLVGYFDRPNLTYRVLPKRDELKQVVEVLERHRGESGIVYCIRRKDVDALTDHLQKRSFNARAYHAGLAPDERRAAQEAFAKEQCDVVVATVAFGMGIDRSNVRFVVHTAMPKSIEHYQQETGRAGRDGLEAECVLLYSAADAMTWRSMLSSPASDDMPADPRFVESALRHLNDLDRYLSGTTCRHRALVEYFGQQYDSESCAACDLCLGETEDVSDGLVVAQKIVSCVYRLNQSWGVGHVISVLRGENIDKIRERRHDTLSTYGIMKQHSRNELRDLIWQLVGQGILEQSGDEYPVLHLTQQSRAVLRGEAEVRLRQPIATQKSGDRKRRRAPAALADDIKVDPTLFESLRQWRRSEADERGVPPYVIFSDKTLREIVRAKPATLIELRGVYGVGDAKLEAFGNAVLAVLSASA